MPVIKDGKQFLTLDDLKPAVEGGGIIDGAKGGLILGNSHTDGGILLIGQHKDEMLYEALAEAEGWEYILSPVATAKNMEYLKNINSEFAGRASKFTEYEIPLNTSVLDARPIIDGIKQTAKLILLSGYAQFVINKFSTKKYLDKVNALNQNTANGN